MAGQISDLGSQSHRLTIIILAQPKDDFRVIESLSISITHHQFPSRNKLKMRRVLGFVPVLGVVRSLVHQIGLAACLHPDGRDLCFSSLNFT